MWSGYVHGSRMFPLPGASPSIRGQVLLSKCSCHQQRFSCYPSTRSLLLTYNQYERAVETGNSGSIYIRVTMSTSPHSAHSFQLLCVYTDTHTCGQCAQNDDSLLAVSRRRSSRGLSPFLPIFIPVSASLPLFPSICSWNR